MSLLYEYSTNSPNNRLRSVCDIWNLAYNLECGQRTYDLPELTGPGKLTSCCINRDIQMINYDINFCVPVEMQGISRNPHVDILFCLGQSIHWDLPEGGKNFELFTGESYIGISEETKKQCIFPVGQNMHILEIKIALSALQSILDVNCVGCSLDRLASKQISSRTHQFSPSIRVILHQLLHCPYNAGLSKLYTQAKLLELLAAYLSETVLQINKPISCTCLCADDIKCIRRAKEILDSNLTDSPTIQLLSRQVGLNEYKLKKGFKELFELPIHTYVIQRKLELAKFLLDSGGVSVSEIACRAGYGNVSHFASAFRKQYGVNPGNYLKFIKGRL
jgi:AraC-like DNA-binding protein